MNEPRVNERIRAREVRVVGPDGSQVGIKPLPEALALARELDLDLVEVADKATPPVVRIMDYGKYKYEAAQRQRESRRNQTAVVLKEMKYRPKIGKADFDTKTRNVEKFLHEGHKVKVTIMFRGREIYHPEIGRKILDDVAETVGHVGRVEVQSKLDGRNMTMVLAPDKKAQAAWEAQRRKGPETADGEPALEGVSSPAADASGGEGEPELRELNGAASDLPPGGPTDSAETIDADATTETDGATETDGTTETDGATDNGTGAVPADAG